MRPVAGLLPVLLLAVVACGDDADSRPAAAAEPSTTTTIPAATAPSTTTEAPATTTTEPPATTTTAAPTTEEVAPGVEVARDLAYRSDDSGPNLLDVYYPTAAEGGPVVVFLHGGFLDKSYPFYQPVVAAIAERGAVVFMPSWEAGMPTDPAYVLRVHDGVACAVSYAVAHAPDYGADPDALVLVGHSGGADVASMAGLQAANPIPDCAVETAPIEAGAMVLWDGDWMGGPLLDRVGDGLPDLLEVATPWTSLADGPRMPITLVTARGSRQELTICGVSDPAGSFWVRDPDGWFRERLEATGALEDDCVDIWEPSVVLAETMRDHGYDVTEIMLEYSSHTWFGDDADVATLADEIVAIAGR